MTSGVDAATALEKLGDIPASYEHEWRVATPMEPLVVRGGIFKWYHVHREGVSVPKQMDTEARRIVSEVVRQGWDLSYGLNFAMIHLSTKHAFLIIGVWRGHQEMWERIYSMELDEGGSFSLAERGDFDNPAACVWELGVICHERMAWHRFLFSNRVEVDRQAWLEDTLSGRV